MAGYNGYKMSNNAVDAYRSGEKPKSKWTKTEIIEECIREKVDPKTIAALKKLPADDVKNQCLRKTSWHHTSSMYNRTDFYSLDSSRLGDIDTSKLKPSKKEAKTTSRVTATYLVWSGTKKHPKAAEVTENGTISGNWFISDSGVRKSTTARGFRLK